LVSSIVPVFPMREITRSRVEIRSVLVLVTVFPTTVRSLICNELEHEHDENDGGKPVPIRTTFELADTLYAEAELEETDTVFLWLGANVMLSYKIPAAIELLKSKLEAATTSLNNAIEDLEFIREQMTVMEVNTARIYNWDVKRRREKREKEKLSGTGEIET